MTLCSCGVLVNSYHDNICLQRKMAQNLVLRLLEEKQTETEVRFMLGLHLPVLAPVAADLDRSARSGGADLLRPVLAT